jgi:HlyD family secretion protein
MAQIAKDRGLILPAPGAGRGRGAGSRTEQPVITTRTVYKLGGTPDKPRPEPVTVRLGITDGSQTEVIEGLQEGEVLISSVFIPGATTTTSAPASNPFGGAPRRF